MKLSRKSLFVLAGVAAAAWWFWYSGSDKTGENGAAVNVTVSPVIRQDVPIQLELVGTVVAQETVAIKSRLDSQLTDVLFKDGETVKEGQLLFKLDDRSLTAQQNELEAQLEKEKAQLINVKLQYERAQKLLAGGTVSQSRVDETKAAYEAQAAQVGATRASLESVRATLSYTKITAPISGRAGTINVTRGNNVKANDQTLVTINQVSPIRVHFAIPERYYDQVKRAMGKEGITVTAKRGETGEQASGTLEYVDNAIDVANGTFAARANFANENEMLWPGMFVNVSLLLGKEPDALTVPAVAIQGDEGNRFVFAVDAEGKKAARKPVVVSQIAGNTAIVASGLSEGERVIVDGLLRVSDGAAVAITDAGKKQP